MMHNCNTGSTTASGKRSIILVADSGATKTEWCAMRGRDDIIAQFLSRGFSPIYESENDIAAGIATEVVPQLNGLTVDAVRFYGTGCIPENVAMVENAIARSFPQAHIAVFSDLIAAAHALCGRAAGIACILGTGSNSCEWNGRQIVKQVSPLGFILGDEGSGATMGKMLVGDALKNRLSAGLKEKLLDRYAVTPADIINRVYRQPFPSRFLASLAPFLKENISDESISRIVDKSFTDFFERNVMQYDYQSKEVNFTGSIALHFSDELKSVAKRLSITVGRIEQSPMKGLIEYHDTTIFDENKTII